jgi:hypothetical protein
VISSPGSPAKTVRVDVLLGALAAVIYGMVALFMIRNGALNIDEGFYGLASRAALSGAVPYRDFGYTQTPLFPYINGAVMRIIGFGFIEQRVVSGAWAALTTALGTAWLWRRHGRLLGLGFAAVMASGLQWMYFAHIGKTNALVGLLVLSAVLLVAARVRLSLQIFAVSLLGVVAVGCRLPVAPFFIVLWAGLLARHFSMRNLGWSLFWPVLFALILIVPFVAEAPRSFWFWTLDFHRESRAVKDWHIDLRAMFPVSPALCFLGLLVAAGLMFKRISLSKPLDLALLALLSALACDILPAGAYPEYPAPLVPGLIFILVAIAAEHRMRPAWTGAALLACVLLNLSVRAPIDRAIRGETSKAAAYVRQFQPGTFPFSGSAGIVALEAGAPVDMRMVMEPFCCTESYSEDEAARLRLMTPGALASFMADARCDVLVMFSDPTRNIVWSMPGFEPISASAVGRWKAILAHDYALDYGDGTYAVFVRRSLYMDSPASNIATGNPTRSP